MTYPLVMAESDRQRVTQEDEQMRAAASERLGEDPPVIVLRRSDEQIANDQGEPDGAERS